MKTIKTPYHVIEPANEMLSLMGLEGDRLIFINKSICADLDSGPPEEDAFVIDSRHNRINTNDFT